MINVHELLIKIFFMQTNHCELQILQACYCLHVHGTLAHRAQAVSGLVNSCLWVVVAVFMLFNDG